jgi:hypothetical protein
MKRIKQMIVSAARTVAGGSTPSVPLMVPHGGGDAGRDFESALELLQGGERRHKLWHRVRLKIPFVPMR